MIRRGKNTTNYTLRTKAITLRYHYSQIGSKEQENYRRVYRSPGIRRCNIAFMFTLLYITLCYVNVVLRYVKVTFRYSMLCLADLCTVKEFNRTDPLLHELTLIWTLTSVHGVHKSTATVRFPAKFDVLFFSTESRPVLGPSQALHGGYQMYYTPPPQKKR